MQPQGHIRPHHLRPHADPTGAPVSAQKIIGTVIVVRISPQKLQHGQQPHIRARLLAQLHLLNQSPRNRPEQGVNLAQPPPAINGNTPTHAPAVRTRTAPAATAASPRPAPHPAGVNAPPIATPMIGTKHWRSGVGSVTGRPKGRKPAAAIPPVTSSDPSRNPSGRCAHHAANPATVASTSVIASATRSTPAIFIILPMRRRCVGGRGLARVLALCLALGQQGHHPGQAVHLRAPAPSPHPTNPRPRGSDARCVSQAVPWHLPMRLYPAFRSHPPAS